MSPSRCAKTPMIKRLFFVFLLVVVPIQMSWGAAAGYCRHESGDAAQHFGHHDHRHHPLPADGKDASGQSSLQPHADCAACHLNCPTATSASSVSVTLPGAFFIADAPRPLSSMFPEGPERPKWMPAA